jgi:hypothetical protein
MVTSRYLTDKKPFLGGSGFPRIWSSSRDEFGFVDGRMGVCLPAGLNTGEATIRYFEKFQNHGVPQIPMGGWKGDFLVHLI